MVGPLEVGRTEARWTSDNNFIALHHYEKAHGYFPSQFDYAQTAVEALSSQGMTTRLAIRFGFIMQRIKERSRLVGKELFEEISPHARRSERVSSTHSRMRGTCPNLSSDRPTFGPLPKGLNFSLVSLSPFFGG